MMDKRELAAHYTTLKPFASITDPDINIVIYEYEHPHLLGMKFIKGKAPRPFLAKIQEHKSYFVVHKKYFSLGRLRYEGHVAEGEKIQSNAPFEEKEKQEKYDPEKRIDYILKHGHHLPVCREDLEIFAINVLRNNVLDLHAMITEEKNRQEQLRKSIEEPKKVEKPEEQEEEEVDEFAKLGWK